ncbi:protein FAM214A-like [Pollicipes pollicipes]|uniref:protein FAM214A-like n=1 Tax=Pollicipes pollicipes TaxID=41117 RepID=UPI001884C5AB|nr:protein FAM214A-like [Pollicipes pollicipes]
MCERTAKGICERDARDTGKRAPCVARERGAGGTGRGVTNGTAERPVDDVGGPTTNGSAALNQKGSRAPKSPNLLKRLFKKDEPQDAVEEQPKETAVPSPASRAAFRRSLDSATSAVFSQKTGLPLSSSPAPLRRGNAFHFDAALTKVKTFSSALNELTADAESESAEPERRPLSASCPAGVVSSLLGSFEESVLNGRLGPVSTVEGFSADIGASGSFHPKHVRLPVTVFFYSLCDNEKIASPYMGLVNLGRKGYHVPKKGTLQVTLFNPHGTVVKMFVVIYDLSAMPPGSQTFLRQRTLYMPVGESPENPDSQKWLRYLIHLRFATGRSGRVYVHTDLRMIIFRKSDMDAAALHTGAGAAHEMRSFVHMPDNPRYSPRK